MENISEEKYPRFLAAFGVLWATLLFLSVPGTAATNRISSVTQIILDPAHASQMIQTNVSFFTESVYRIPPAGMDYPEVQALFQKDIFQDVFEPDTESALRRLEIEFAISLPAVLLLNQIILRLLVTAETGYFYTPFNRVQNIYYYSSSILISGAIAWQDYTDQKRKREALGQRWDLFRKRF